MRNFFDMRFVCCTVVLLLAAAAASAQDGQRFALHGFGTLGVVRSTAKEADFVSGFFEPNGAGHTSNWAAGIDTKLGLQADARIAEKLSGVLQIVSLHGYDNTYTPRVEWANLKYQITPDFNVRVGRTVTMPFMVSDSRQVGYANPWIRPPQEVYGLIPITNKDGIDSTLKLHAGGMTSSLHASYGGTSLKLPGSGTVQAKDYFDISNTVERGPLTARLSYSSGRVDLHTSTLDGLVSGYEQFGAALAAMGASQSAAEARAVAARYRFEDAPISVFAAGASYDAARWLVMAEWARFNGHSILANSSAWYVSAAYRFGAFTPYAIVARLDAERRSDPGVNAAGLPPPVAASATALNAGLNRLLDGTAFAQRSIAFGLRWDVARNIALKAQYDQLRLASWSSGRLGNVQPNFQPGATVKVMSFAVDFVF